MNAPRDVDPADTGLAALATILGMHRVAINPAQLRHELGHTRALTADEMVRVARQQPGVRARALTARFEQLPRLPLPVLAEGPEGWFLIGRVSAEEALIHQPGRPVEKCPRERLGQLWSGRVVLIATREGIEGAAGRFDVSWFLPQVIRYRHLIGEVLLLTLAINLLGLVAPLFFQNIIDKVLVHDTQSTLKVLVIGFVAVSILEVAFGWLRTRLYSEMGQKLDVELGAKLFRHLLRLPVAYFEQRRVGDTVMRVRQLEAIREFLTNASLYVIVDPAFIVIFLAAMWFYSHALFAIAMLTLPAYVAVTLLVTGTMRRGLAEKFERGSANNALLVESVSAMQTVKAAAVEPQWRDRWERQLAGYSGASQRVINLGNSSSQAVQLITKLGFAATLYVGAREVMAGALTVGGLVAFNMLAQRVASPVIRMAQLWQDFQQVRISIERLGDVMNAGAEPVLRSGVTLPALKGRIRFDRVHFRYGTESGWTLEDISLDLAPGATLGIAGPSGSGKSTLAKLIQRLYVPTSGRIFVDDVDIAQVDPSWLRRQIGVVLQENLLFNRSIRENIALSNPAAPLEAVMAAASLAGAHDFILGLPLGYDTVVEERGANLSGGQRQRIAIARALITQPRILIFDEATSALDAETEEIVNGNLKAMARGRTVIIVAHRLSALRPCERIMTLDGGRIVEFGTHGELLARNGRYAGLYRRQTGVGE